MYKEHNKLKAQVNTYFCWYWKKLSNTCFWNRSRAHRKKRRVRESCLASKRSYVDGLTIKLYSFRHNFLRWSLNFKWDGCDIFFLTDIWWRWWVSQYHFLKTFTGKFFWLLKSVYSESVTLCITLWAHLPSPRLNFPSVSRIVYS
jgi:hypothetical protein